jgi:NAD-dependent deacetylase
VVLYEETLDQEELMKAVDFISHAEVLIVGGTSLVVYPAAGLLQYYLGDKLILVNRSVTPYDQRANYVLHGDISKVLPELIR